MRLLITACEFFVEENMKKVSHTYEYQLTDDAAFRQRALHDLEARLRKAENKMQNVVSAITESGHNDWLIKQGNQLQDEIEMYKNEISIIEKRSDRKLLTEEQIYDYLSTNANIRNMDRMKQKAVISSYVEKVIVYEDSIDIHLYIDKNNNPGRGVGMWIRWLEMTFFVLYPQYLFYHIDTKRISS